MRIINSGTIESPSVAYYKTRDDLFNAIMKECRRAYSERITLSNGVIPAQVNNTSPAIQEGIALIIEDIFTQLAEFKAEPTITREDASNCIDAL